MTTTSTLLIVSILVFASAALLVAAAAETLSRREQIRQRYRAMTVATHGAAGLSLGERRGLTRIEPGRVGLGPDAYLRLRLRLVRAGIFNPDGPVAFTLVRWGGLVLVPLLGAALLATLAPYWSVAAKASTLLLLLILAYLAPAAYLSRRAGEQRSAYQNAFPDVLDMLVVCINAGLSLEAALERIARELGPDEASLRVNLDLMAAEARAGRGTSEALRDFAERLDLPEARSLAALLQQTIELGTDVAGTLRIFSDEMRDKRMSRAEERAAALPPKLTLPLGLFIFPVVLIVVLTPAVIRVLRVTSP